MKEIPFPDGVIPLEIFVGSVGKDRYTDKAEGRGGVVDYGFDYTDRPVSLFLRIKAADAADFRLLRNEVFATFDVGSAFYVAESDVPSRVLKVVVDESYIPDRLTEEYADFDINCRTLDSVFWESKYTTLELHDSGFAHSAEKYGLVDNIDDEKVQYRFTNDSTLLTGVQWNDGGIEVSTGAVQPSNLNNIYSNEITVSPGQRIEFEETSKHPNINYWRAFEYNGNEFIGVIEGQPGTNTVSLTTRGNRIRFATSVHPNQPVRAGNVGVTITPQIKRLSNTANFTVYNAGNVTVEPESMLLHIFVTSATGDSITIKNNTTGETFTLNRKMNARHIQVNGMVVTDGTTQVFRDTNKRFISLAPGDNSITVTGATFNEIRFNFKYYYK